MKLCMAVVSFLCLGAAAHIRGHIQEEERELLVAGSVSLGLGQFLVGSAAQQYSDPSAKQNPGKELVAIYGFEFSWIREYDGTVKMKDAKIHGPEGEPPNDCPNSLTPPQSYTANEIATNNYRKRGVGYFQFEMEMTTTEPPLTDNWNKIDSISGEQNCLGNALPTGATVGFEYSHVSSTVYDIESSTGCEDNGDTRYEDDGAVLIYRPADDCVDEECTRNLGVSFCEFAWNETGIPSTTQQCFVSGNAAQEAATQSDLEGLFDLANTDSTGGLNKAEFEGFWEDVGLNMTEFEAFWVDMDHSSGESVLDQLFTSFDVIKNPNNRVSRFEFGAGLANLTLFSMDNVAAYKNLHNCQNSDLGFDTPGCSGYA